MYSQIEIFEIIFNCKSREELDAVARGFAHLLVCHYQPGLRLIKKLVDIKQKRLDDGPTA